MEPIGVEFWNERTGEVLYEAEPVDDAHDGPTLVIEWDEKGNARLSQGR